MGNREATFKPHGTIRRRRGDNPRVPYDHQREAMNNLSLLNGELDSFRTLVVLPTGGGKTFTLVSWLLEHAVNERIKVLWVAHTQTLLEQAATEFRNCAYVDVLPNITSFSYRIVSGKPEHDKFSDIKPRDAVLIAGKDALVNNASKSEEFARWLNGEDRVYMIIDEAHHVPARSYKALIGDIAERVGHFNLIGITATPFRTKESETGVLGAVFTDGVRDGVVCPGASIVAYEITLNELIKRRILSQPILEEYGTGESFDSDFEEYDWDAILNRDDLPLGIQQKMAENAPRNKLIVDTYVKNRELYGKTIVFAVNRAHAIQLNREFQKRHVRSGYLVSSASGSARSSNNGKASALKGYESGAIDVLIGVNMLTEGVDVPATQTVFLARPTSSEILMTQMVGRAMRGVKANGTPKAYIVSFVDDWSQRIAWARPADILGDVVGDNQRAIKSGKASRSYSVDDLEAFTDELMSLIDGNSPESVEYSAHVPIGAYVFTLIEYPEIEAAELVERPFQVLVYTGTADAYAAFMRGLPELFEDMAVDADDFLPEHLLEKLADAAIGEYFNDEMVPAYDSSDIKHVLEYFWAYERAPEYYDYDVADAALLDFVGIARDIIEINPTPAQQREYVHQLWCGDESGLLESVFSNELVYNRLVNLEIMRVLAPDAFRPGALLRPKDGIEHAPIEVIEELDPDYYAQLFDEAFEFYIEDEQGAMCAGCGRQSWNRGSFVLDYLYPLSSGGLSESDNIELICKRCADWDGTRYHPYFGDPADCYTPKDIAQIVIAKHLPLRKAVDFLHWVFMTENERLLSEQRYSERLFIRDVVDSLYELGNGASRRDVQHFLKLFRLEYLYLNEGQVARMSMRELLALAGRKRRTRDVCDTLDRAFEGLGITPLHNGVACDVETIGLDDEVEFRVGGLLPGTTPFDEWIAQIQLAAARMKVDSNDAHVRYANPFALDEHEWENLEILKRKILPKRKHERKNDFDAKTRIRHDKDYVVLFCEGYLVAAYSKITRKVYLVSHNDEPAYSWDYPTSRARRVREFVGQMRHKRYLPAKDELPYEEYVTLVTLLPGADVHEDVGTLLDGLDGEFRQ